MRPWPASFCAKGVASVSKSSGSLFAAASVSYFWMYDGRSGVVMRLSANPGWSSAYSSAICCIAVITPPSAGRESSHEISRGSTSPSGLTSVGSAPPAEPAQPARARVAATAEGDEGRGALRGDHCRNLR